MPGKKMSKRFIALTSGWIPVFFLLMLAAALATGQARNDRIAAVSPVAPVAVEVLITLPEDVRTTLDAVREIIDAGQPARAATHDQQGAL